MCVLSASRRFVRFAESTSAKTAVCELNGWVLNGAKINVELSKDTAEKIKQGISSYCHNKFVVSFFVDQFCFRSIKHPVCV